MAGGVAQHREVGEDGVDGEDHGDQGDAGRPGPLPGLEADRLGVGELVRHGARPDEADQQHGVEQEEEAGPDEVVFAHRAHDVAALDVREHEVAGREGHHAGDEAEEGRALARPLREERHEDDRQNRDEVDGVHVLQVGEDGADGVQHRRERHGAEGDEEAEVFAGADGREFVGLGLELAVDAEREERAGGVEGGVEAGEDGARHDGREEARKPRGQHRAHQFAVGVGLAQESGVGVYHGG